MADDNKQVDMRPVMTAHDVMAWFELAAGIYERGILRNKKGPAGILAIMMFAREMTLTGKRPGTGMDLMTDVHQQARKLLFGLAKFAGVTITITVDRASRQLIATLREYLEQPMIPDEIKRQCVAWLTDNDGAWAADVAGRYYREMMRFIPVEGRSMKESATGKQLNLITDLLKCRAVPDHMRRQGHQFLKAASSERVKAVASAWIEALTFYNMKDRTGVDNTVDNV